MALLSIHGDGATRERGQALVEFAFVAPIMVLLLMAAIQFGLIFERQIGITNAVREAARRGATLPTSSVAAAGINAAWTRDQLLSLLVNAQGYTSSDVQNVQACFSTPAAPNDKDPSGNFQVVVTVSAEYKHPLFLPIITQLLDGIDGANPPDVPPALHIGTSAQFRVEQDGSNNLGSGACT